MEYEVPEYSKHFGRYHVSASGGTQQLDEHILKLYLRKEYKMNFPMSARPRAGQIVQTVADICLGLHEYSPIKGQQDKGDFSQALRHGMAEYMTYQPLTWDGGADAEAFAEFKNHIGDMSRHAVDGLTEFFGDEEIEGEYQRYYKDPRIDVPVTLFLDYASEGRQIDLKCSLPVRNPPRKDGTRTWRVPKPKTEPTPQQVMQQAVYYKSTGLAPGLLFVTSAGYNIVTAENCEALQPERLEEAYENIVRRWFAAQKLMQVANGNWKELFSLVPPDFGMIATRHGKEILNIAKQAWRTE